MSHVVGTVQQASPHVVVGPDSGQPATTAGVWEARYAYAPATPT